MQNENKNRDQVNNDPQEQNTQGRSSFSTGSTTQGGSNYGQGSSNLGGEAYQQGASSNSGSNYNNEADRLGSSSTGTNNEGSSASNQGAGESDESTASQKNATQQDVNWNGNEERNDPRRDEDEDADPKEGDRRDTSLEKASGMTKDEQNGDQTRGKSGGWSRSSTDGENNY